MRNKDEKERRERDDSDSCQLLLVGGNPNATDTTVSHHIDTLGPLYNRHHWKPTFCVVNGGVPNSDASSISRAHDASAIKNDVIMRSWVYLLRNWVVEHNVAAFSGLSFAER